MKTISPAFATYLQQPYQKLCTCWLVTRQDGGVYTFTDHDQDLSLPVAYFPTQGDRIYLSAIGYQPSNIETSSDLDVDNMNVQGVLFDSQTITEQELFAGLWDFASVSIFLVNWSDFTMGPVPLMAGNLGKVTIKRGVFVAELRSLMQAYTRGIGVLRSPGCRADLGDSKCKVVLDPDIWMANTAYVETMPYEAGVGSVVKPTVANGYYFYCTVAGTSGGSEPSWITTIGGSTSDGSITWTTGYAFTVASTVGGVNPDNQTFYDNSLNQPGPAGGVAITNVTNANPGHVTLALAVPVESGQALTISGITTMTLLNVVTIADNVSGTGFDLGIDTSNTAVYGTYSGGGGTVTPLGNSGFFDGGVVTWLSGDNIGLSMEVKTYVPGQVTLVLPMPYTIQIGDTYSIKAGCDKQINTCRDRFNNTINMRAEPYVPGQDRLLQIGSHS